MQVSPFSTDVDHALQHLEKSAVIAKSKGCDILVTPEMYLTGYNIGPAEVQRLAQPKDGQYFEEVAKIARHNAIAILYGYPERVPDQDAPFNSVQLIDDLGKIAGNYRKTHLYGQVDRTQFLQGERRSFLISLKGWKIALAICYDIEFPELARAYAQDGADIILAPTANMTPYDSVATRLVPARAQENGVFVVYANYSGSEGHFDYCGKSCICGPDGEDLARAHKPETLIFAQLDRAMIAEVRQGASYLADVRTEIYASKNTGTSEHD